MVKIEFKEESLITKLIDSPLVNGLVYGLGSGILAYDDFTHYGFYDNYFHNVEHALVHLAVPLALGSIGFISKRNNKNSIRDVDSGLYNWNYFRKKLTEYNSISNNSLSNFDDYPNSVCVIGLDNLKKFSNISEHDKNSVFNLANSLNHVLPNCDTIARTSISEVSIISHLKEDELSNLVSMIREPFLSDLDFPISYGTSPINSLEDKLFPTIVNAKIRRAFRDFRENNGKNVYSIFVDSLNARDIETRKHSDRVVDYASGFGKYLNLSENHIISLEVQASLHDIGKLNIPDSILLKKGKLTKEEYEIIKIHPQIGFDLIDPVIPEIPSEYFYGILDHHEKWDGSGYPRGLSGEDISFDGRLLALCDVYDALTSSRTYRDVNRWTPENTLQLINNGLGSHFDPILGEKFIDYIVNEEDINFK